jgi:hypothetical protein
MRDPLCGLAWTLLFVGLALMAGVGLWVLVEWAEEIRPPPNVVQPLR